MKMEAKTKQVFAPTPSATFEIIRTTASQMEGEQTMAQWFGGTPEQLTGSGGSGRVRGAVPVSNGGGATWHRTINQRMFTSNSSSRLDE